MDINQRQALMESLKQRAKKASSSVSTKVEAQKGDFSVVITSDVIDHLYKNNSVGKIRVAELDDDTIALINSDAQEAAQEMLDTFANSFDTESIQDKTLITAKTAGQEKTAAHETLDEHTWQMVTQKQFDDQKPALHPRSDDYPKNITQKQIPEAGQRPGTYEEITESQFAQEKTTFYDKPLEGGKRILEDRNIITEGQFEEGVSDYSDHGKSERGEEGAKFDGDLAKQTKMIGEKQLAELLKHHEWTEPLTITEGKDQLGKQDGELARITAEIAEKIIKEALSTLGNTVLAAGVTPDNLSKLVQRLVSHPSKYPVLADTITKFVDHDVKPIQEKVAKAKYFGKVANAGNDWGNELVADILVRQLAKLSYNPKFVVDGLVALSNREDFVDQIDTATNQILEAKEEIVEASTDNVDVFQQVLDGEHNKPAVEGSAKEDGLYEYVGTIEEVKTSTEDRDKFTAAAADYAKNVIKANIENQNIDLQPLSIDVNEEKGSFKIQMKDAAFEDKKLETRADNRRKLAKEAQFGGGGGMPPAGADQMGNPMAPPGGADMGAAPPGEAFSQEPPPMDEDLGEPEIGGEPKPPGAICPVCGSEDVDVDNGEFRCNGCGAEGTIHVRLDVNKWPETISETGENEEPGFGLGAEDDQSLDMGDELAPGGEGSGTTLPNVPIGASVRVTPHLLEKLSSQKIDIGSVCPNCGGHNTDMQKSASKKGQDGICYDCLQEYNFQVKANVKKAHNVFAQYVWTPKIAEACDSCGRLKASFVKSLSDYGLRFTDFEKLSMKEKGEVILKMSKANALNLVTADNDTSLNKYAAAFKQKFEKFPSASCREKIARHYGENATAMSGPCQGKPLSDCICSQLEDLGIYTDGLAAKVAHVVSSEDPIINNPAETCIKMFINDNYSVKDACTICDGLRASAATDEELMIEAIAQISAPMGNPTKPMPVKPMGAPAKPMPAPEEGMAAAPPVKPMMETPTESPGGEFLGTPQISPAEMDMTGKPMAQPMDAAPMMEPNPMDEPVVDDVPVDDVGEGQLELPVDDAGDGHLDIEFEGDFGDEGLDMGLEDEGDLKTIIVDGLQSIIDALQGNLGDNMIDLTGDEDVLDVGDVTEDTVDDNGLGDDVDIVDEEIPGVMNDETEGDEDILKEGEPEEELVAPMESKPMETPEELAVPVAAEAEEVTQKEADTKEAEVEANEEEANTEEDTMENTEANTTEEIVKEASTQELDGMLYRMKSGTISKTNDALDNIIDGLVNSNPDLFKVAGKTDGDVKKVVRKEANESKLTETPAQDTSEIGKVKDGKTMGHEESLDLSGPDVARGDATIGDEGTEVKVDDSDRPSVPHGAPLMDGEEHYTPEKGNVVDGNQGGGPMTSAAETEEQVTKVAFTIDKGHKIYDRLDTKLSEGDTSVKLTDGKSYTMGREADSILLTEIETVAGKKSKKCVKPMEEGKCECSADSDEEEVKEAGSEESVQKEAQTVSPKSVEKLEDDPDINPTSGPGAGKTHADEAHSLGVDEKKPSEGMSEPDVPEAPDGGQLEREHTYDNALDGPNIPAGGGMNDEYDQNEKNTPEKLDQTLGKENDIAAMAETNKERATKIAGQMLKTQRITIDELPDKIAELSKASSEILDDLENMMKEASTKKGLQKAATGVESSFQISSPGTSDDQVSLKDNIQSLFRLDQRNQDYESHSSGNPRLWH